MTSCTRGGRRAELRRQPSGLGELCVEVFGTDAKLGQVVLQLDARNPVDNGRQLVVANARTDAAQSARDLALSPLQADQFQRRRRLRLLRCHTSRPLTKWPGLRYPKARPVTVP
jgi:hypothetical protein